MIHPLMRIPLIAFAFSTLPLAARIVSGVEIADQVRWEGRILPLFGAASHRQLAFKIYVAAFYLEGTNLTARQLIDTDEPIVFRTHYTMTIPQGMLLDGVRRHLKKVFGDPPAGFQKETDAFLRGYVRGIASGDTIEIRWRKDVGTEMVFSGKVTATIPGIEFKKRLFASWFNPETADRDFINALPLSGQR